MNVGRSGHHYLPPYEFPGLIVNSFLLLQIVKMLKQVRRHNGNSTTPGFSFESSPTQSNFIQLRNKQKLGIMVFTVDLLVILICIGAGIPTVTGKWIAFFFGCLFIPNLHTPDETTRLYTVHRTCKTPSSSPPSNTPPVISFIYKIYPCMILIYISSQCDYQQKAYYDCHGFIFVYFGGGILLILFS